MGVALTAGQEATHGSNRGQIRSVTFRNIAVTAWAVPYSILYGYDDRHRVENVRLRD
jgi:hypothetical protein